jgi:hypothetical protein
MTADVTAATDAYRRYRPTPGARRANRIIERKG